MKSLSDTVDDYLAELRFSASDSVEATGVSLTAQRDLRRRKFMPSIEGHARFDVKDVARLALIASLGRLGIGPKDASTFAEKAAEAVATRVSVLKRRELLSVISVDDSHHDDDQRRYLIWFGGDDFEVSDTSTSQTNDGSIDVESYVVIDCDALARRISHAEVMDKLTDLIKLNSELMNNK